MIANIDTRFITLLGKPLGQSFAARMQNAAYKAMGLNLLYFYTEVENDHLGQVVEGLRYLPFAGFAVTKPNKVEVLKYLDELDPLCEKMGASNTVVVQPDGRLKGYNTDGIGFHISLMEAFPLLDYKEKVFFCIGAGGAGRAMSSVLAYYGAKKIYITDIYAPAAESLVEDINSKFAPVAELVEYNRTAIMDAVRDSCVIMNASGIGMAPHLGESPVDKSVLNPGHICFDACYNPAKTQFLLDAEEAGCKILNGLGMSLYQGAAQIKLWTGKEAPVDVMRDELMAILAEKK